MATDRDNLMTQLRAEMLLEGTKGLFLINGGGAIALASWLQAVWEEPWAVPMLRWHISAIISFAVGVALAAVVHLARYLGSLHRNATFPKRNPWWWAHLGASLFSILCFAFAGVLIAIGAYRGIPQSGVTVTPISQQGTLLMTNYEIASVILQGFTLLVLALTLWKLFEYTRETRRLANAAEEEMSKPCVEVFEQTDQTDAAILEGHSSSIAGMDSIAFRNIGTGVALNFRYEIQTSAPKPYSAAGPSLAPGQIFSSSVARNALSDPASVICEFATLSGTKYRTESKVEGRRWVKTTRFQKST